jgi:hypothetical protein|tara:strand:+ start:636 stop:863 length:228 start_codon:yes stop_codon:yes gene_type:complete
MRTVINRKVSKASSVKISDFFLLNQQKKHFMKNIVVATLFLLLSANAFACYDESLSDKDNFDNCMVEAERNPTAS